MIIRLWSAAILLTLPIAISACAPVDAVTKRNTFGQPPAYVDGYSTGCGSGYVASGHPYASAGKDVSRYLSDPVYKTGWDDGFATCKGQYDSIGNSLRR
ncbi:MAG: hypothetical protein HY888_07790 [Deltaproteobacteria bacterium]|nr:hypothetical protein [Deltaproteobacteria bacterium]